MLLGDRTAPGSHGNFPLNDKQLSVRRTSHWTCRGLELQDHLTFEPRDLEMTHQLFPTFSDHAEPHHLIGHEETWVSVAANSINNYENGLPEAAHFEPSSR